MPTPPELYRLSEGQKQVLRLYYRRLTADEVAQQLGISTHTVHQRLKRARELLGANSSLIAARLLAEAEEEGLYDRVVYEPNGVPTKPDDELEKRHQRPWWPWRSKGRPRNDLTGPGKALAILAIAGAFMAIVAIYLVAAIALSRFR